LTSHKKKITAPIFILGNREGGGLKEKKRSIQGWLEKKDNTFVWKKNLAQKGRKESPTPPERDSGFPHGAGENQRVILRKREKKKKLRRRGAGQEKKKSRKEILN